MDVRPHGAFDVSTSSRTVVSGFCDVGFLCRKGWSTTTGASLIRRPEMDAPAQEKAKKAAWNVSSIGILFCAA